MNAIDTGREQLLAWQARRPSNWYAENPALRDLVEMHLGEGEHTSVQGRLGAFGALMAADTEALVHRSSTEPGMPRLERFSGLGERTEEVVFDGAAHEVGRRLYGSGVMAMTLNPEQAIEQAALVLLSAHHGEAGHVCPLACTAGFIKVLRRAGHPWLQARYLERLTDPDYDRRLYASQFLTEVQGGSDVGANACRATLVRPGDQARPALWRLQGEKWFCSVADAPLFLVTARPDGAPPGTKGLGLFAVPRQVGPDELGAADAATRTNDFSLRRLKNKLGTRAMASAELDFEGALAWQLGPLEQGFANVVGVVLNTSRVFNALACAGSMQRAFLEASSFARHRQAFGVAIERFALVREALATLYAEAQAATASTLDVVAMQGDPAREAAWRIGLNMNKYWTSVRNTQMVRTAIEVLGGNGTIEDFSCLPRLYRDAMVTESWEGTHNVLVAQTWRDMQRHGLHRPWLTLMGDRAARLEGAQADEIRRRLQRLQDDAEALAARRDEGATVALRRWIDRAMVSWQTLCLLELSRWQRQRGAAALPDSVAALLHALHPDLPAVSGPRWWPGAERT